MTDRSDRKARDVAVAEFVYRHEAEFAAGFLEDAGIPFRLQIDDAGGADLGVTISRPALLWVRAIDEEVARELLAVDDQVHPEAERLPAIRRPPVAPGEPRLSGVERGVAAGLAAAFAVASLVVPAGAATPLWWAACGVLGLLLGAAALLGRAPAALRSTLRALSGDAP